MKGVFIEFVRDYEDKPPVFIQGTDFKSIKLKIEQMFPEANVVNFSWVDSDFERDYDAWISVYYDMGSLEYTVRVKTVEEIL